MLAPSLEVPCALACGMDRPARGSIGATWCIPVTLLALLAVTYAQPSPDPPSPLAPSDTAGLIAYVTPAGRPALVDPSSGASYRLDERAQRTQFPAWSPDGDAVTFISTGPEGPGVDLYRPALGQRAQVYGNADEPPIYHGWSPDGRRLAVLANRVGGLGLYLVDVAAASADASSLAPERTASEPGDALAIEHFLASGAPFYWDWTPAGDALLVHRNVMSAEAEVGVTGLDVYALDPTFAAPGAFQSPAVSPSGAWAAYATRDGGDTRRVVLEQLAQPGPGEARRELSHRGFAAFAWHPRRDLLAVQRAVLDGPHAYGPIVTLDAESGDLEPLVDDLALAFWWSPDGARIAYLAPVPSAPPEREQQVMDRVQSVNGRMALRVVEVASGDLRELARFTPSPLFLRQYLPFFDQYARSHRLWSPASDALVVPVVDPTGGRVLRVYGLDGSVRTLVPGDMPAWNVR